MVEFVLPTPKKIDKKEGQFVLTPAVYTDCKEFCEFANTLAVALEKMYDISICKKAGGVTLVYDANIEKGAYTYDADGEIVLKASDADGISSAIATLLQAVDHNVVTNELTSEILHIEDKSDKEYRAVMLDLATTWHPLRTVLRLMDVCFFLKIHHVHMHFIDNVACRIPSKAYPNITTPKYSYSYEDIVTMRDYARARGLVIIPEFEVPGHAQMLVKNYPDVFGNVLDGDPGNEKSEIGSSIKIDHIVCAGSEKAMAAVKVLLAEMIEMFPESEYIHIGGDEAFIKVWNYCPTCRNYMKEHGIEDEYELYSDYVGRVAQLVIDMDRTPIVWEGFPKKGAHRIPKKTIVIAWESLYNMPDDLLEQGFKIINGSWQPLYIVFNKYRWTPQNIMDWNVYNWQHWFHKSDAMLNPVTVAPTEQVWGAQISLWGTSYETEICPLMENACALVERVWNVRRTLDYPTFHIRMDKVCRKMTKLIMEV